MKFRNIQLHTLISMLLSLFLLLAVLPSGWAEGDPIQDPQAGIGEETTAPEGSAAAESVPGQSDWETRLLLMLQEHDANPDTIAAGYYNLATGEEHYYNGDQYRVSGSMYKVPLNFPQGPWFPLRCPPGDPGSDHLPPIRTEARRPEGTGSKALKSMYAVVYFETS